MNYYEIVAEVVESFRKTKKIEKLRVSNYLEYQDCIFLVCDTDDGIINNNDPYIGFKVRIPSDDFLPSERPIDRKAGIKDNLPQDVVVRLRVAYQIYSKYKEAKEQIGK